MSAYFAQLGKACNIIPEGNQRYLQPGVHQPGAKTMDLGAFSCPIHAGEAYESALFVFGVRLHCHAATISQYLDFRALYWWGRLGLASERPTTVPTATAAPISTPTLIIRERVRRCFAGAMTAPAGRDAATPMPFS
jgi:hypothetical protein